MTGSDDPKTLVGGLIGQGLPGGFPARKAVKGVQGAIFGGDDDENKEKDRKKRRRDASLLTRDTSNPLGNVSGQRF